jgi:hypothetical protein
MLLESYEFELSYNVEAFDNIAFNYRSNYSLLKGISSSFGALKI